MELHDFLVGIHMVPEAVMLIKNINITEKEYLRGSDLFHNDKQRFYHSVLEYPDFRIRFLYYFSRMACETYEWYQQEGIEERIYWDTFYDLTLWCNNSYRDYGEYGINQYDWFFRHIEGRIFRLGRLEFEVMESEWDINYEEKVIRKGDTVVSIHIPQGTRLDVHKIKDSFEQAHKYMGNAYLYLCHSWLLYPGLSAMLNKESNILKFQKFFHILEVDYDGKEAEERIYHEKQDNPELYPEVTSLQRNVKHYLLSGQRMGSGLGVLK